MLFSTVSVPLLKMPPPKQAFSSSMVITDRAVGNGHRTVVEDAAATQRRRKTANVTADYAVGEGQGAAIPNTTTVRKSSCRHV